MPLRIAVKHCAYRGCKRPMKGDRSKCCRGEGCRKAEGGTECTLPGCTRMMRGYNRKCQVGRGVAMRGLLQ